MLAVLFEMDGRLWGADALLIETVIPAVRLRPVQGAPDWIAGAFNYKGMVVPAADLSAIVCSRPSERVFSTRYMLVKMSAGGREGLVALVAERVTGVAEIDDAEIGPSAGNSFAGGVFSAGGRIAQIVEIDRLACSEAAAEILGLFYP